jgi:hypothetical protein
MVLSQPNAHFTLAVKSTIFDQGGKSLDIASTHAIQQLRAILQHLIASSDEPSSVVNNTTIRATPSIDTTSNLKASQANPVRAFLELKVILIPALEHVALHLPYHIADVLGTWMVVCEGRWQTPGECMLDNMEDGICIQDRARFIEDGLAGPEELC